MKILFSIHALDRMEQRKIKPVEVESIINDPDGKIKQSRDKWIFYKKLKHRHDNDIAAVAVHQDDQSFEVLTVMVNFEVYR